MGPRARGAIIVAIVAGSAAAARVLLSPGEAPAPSTAPKLYVPGPPPPAPQANCEIKTANGVAYTVCR